MTLSRRPLRLLTAGATTSANVRPVTPTGRVFYGTLGGETVGGENLARCMWVLRRRQQKEDGKGGLLKRATLVRLLRRRLAAKKKQQKR